jgi:integrase/recombinase XerD
LTKVLVNWEINPRGSQEDIDIVLRRYGKYLEEKGFRSSTIDGYVSNLSRYLKAVATQYPTLDDVKQFRSTLFEKRLSRSTINNYSFAVAEYHIMIGASSEEVKQPFLSRDNRIPDYFSQDDVNNIFAVCHNLKHLAMMQTLFYGCLRASELCNLDDSDLDLKSLTLRIRNGKGGKDGIVYIQDECARTLKQCLVIRPPLLIDGRQPLFYSDLGNRWKRKNLLHMFMHYKKRAGIEKRGGLHVFARHTPATIMISKGCDIRIVQTLLRHNDIRTTLRYAHVSDSTRQEWYNKTLTLIQDGKHSL